MNSSVAETMIKIDSVNFSYSSGSEDRENQNEGCLKNINLEVKRGEVVLLCGESGCGKTTLTRLVNGLIPHFYEGELEGRILIDGKTINDLPLYETAKYVGSVFQNPRSQFFNIDTLSEIAFGCENQGLPAEVIEKRLEETVYDFKMEHLKKRSIFDLSGGEKQKIACASVSAGEPDIFVLDEPSSNLDIKTTLELAGMISRWKAQGKTVIIAEHRLYYLVELADRVLYMKNGEIKEELTVSGLKALGEDKLSKMGLRSLNMKSFSTEIGQTGSGQTADPLASGVKELELSNFYHCYEKSGHNLEIDEVTLPKEGVIAIVGNNGSGKTTFARVLAGLQKKCRGVIEYDGKRLVKARERLNEVFMVMQDVNHQLFTESVMDEVLLSMKEEDEKAGEAILTALDLLQFKECHPMGLSGGQKQRVAIASAIASNRDIIVFDEPTSGLDFIHMKEVSSLLHKLREERKTVFVITHDLELIFSCCSHILHMEKGRIKGNFPLDEKGKNRLIETFFKT